ncbi:MAG: hypothetical protein HY329_01085 [Chloroflexi bacterium]|nr:hypothetical protein [Chloroflexota bacterium]
MQPEVKDTSTRPPAGGPTVAGLVPMNVGPSGTAFAERRTRSGSGPEAVRTATPIESEAGQLRVDVFVSLFVAISLLLAGWGQGLVMLAVSGLLFVVSVIIYREQGYDRSHLWAKITGGAAIAVAAFTIYDVLL